MNWSNMLLVAAVGATMLVVVAGFVNMFRGSNPRRSQQLMRWRVGLQFGALIVALAILFFKR